MSRTYIYIDGFNFYYGAVIDTPYKWLDFMAMCKALLGPYHDILCIKYFTARVRPTPDDQQKNIRQETYLRALEAYIPEIEIIYGHFSKRTKEFPLASPKPPKYTEWVIHIEEKGSDVNLAVHFLNDAWLDNYDCGVIISNDSDLAEAVRLVSSDNKKIVLVINPHKPTETSKKLSKYATNTKTIDKSSLGTYQLPDTIPGTTISKPKKW